MNNNEFYNSWDYELVDNVDVYNSDIELIVVDLPIFIKKDGNAGSVTSYKYNNLNEWFEDIAVRANWGLRELYVYTIETSALMYDPATFIPKKVFIVRQCFN